MELLQFAIPQRLGEKVAEAVTLVSGGATLIGGLGWWVNGDGLVEREPISLLLVGVVERDANLVIEIVKEILRAEKESAVWYVRGGKPVLEWL
jgi:hypothetical protein